MLPSNKPGRHGRPGFFRTPVACAVAAVLAVAGAADTGVAAEGAPVVESVDSVSVEQLRALVAQLDGQLDTLDAAIEDGDARLVALVETMEATEDPEARARLDRVIGKLTAALDEMQSQRQEVAVLTEDLAAKLEALEAQAGQAGGKE